MYWRLDSHNYPPKIVNIASGEIHRETAVNVEYSEEKFSAPQRLYKKCAWKFLSRGSSFQGG